MYTSSALNWFPVTATLVKAHNATRPMVVDMCIREIELRGKTNLLLFSWNIAIFFTHFDHMFRKSIFLLMFYNHFIVLDQTALYVSEQELNCSPNINSVQ